MSKGFEITYQNRECLHFINKKIHSSLDLSKSLSDFKEKVTKLLEIKNLNEWSAQSFKSKEEIRNTALSLAGECIAVLLNKLSQSEEALDIASSQIKKLENMVIILGRY